MRGSTPLDPLGFGPLPSEVIEEPEIEVDEGEIGDTIYISDLQQLNKVKPGDTIYICDPASRNQIMDVFKPIPPSPRVERMQQAIEKFQRDVMSQFLLTGHALIRQHVDTENETIKQELLRLDPADRERLIHGEIVMEPEADSKSKPKAVKCEDVDMVLARVGVKRENAGTELMKLITTTLRYHDMKTAVTNARRYLKS